MPKDTTLLILLGDKFYTHNFHEKDGTATFEEGTEVLYRVDANGYVYDRAGRIGSFNLDSRNLWYFEGLSGLITETGNKSLRKAEVKVFLKLLDGV